MKDSKRKGKAIDDIPLKPIPIVKEKLVVLAMASKRVKVKVQKFPYVNFIHYNNINSNQIQF